VTGASDVFSLGSTLVFAATGHPPFHGANPVETVFMLLREGPDLEGLPEELRPLIESCMQMDPPARPNPADLQAQLAAAQSRANTALTVGIAGIVLGVLGLAVAAMTLARRRPDATTTAAATGTAATRGD
jgi:serine/threonine protein kinase